MQQVKDGDLDKLGLLFERYHRRLFGFFYRLTSRRDISEDLVQGVFERILRYRNSYSNDGSFSTWIFRIARNLHADHFRRTEKMGDQDRPDNWDSFQSDDGGPEFESAANRERMLLSAALEKLDPLKKEPLLLSRFQGFKYREIAEILECSESAVKVRIFRGINELKEIVNDLKQQEKYD